MFPGMKSLEIDLDVVDAADHNWILNKRLENKLRHISPQRSARSQISTNTPDFNYEQEEHMPICKAIISAINEDEEYLSPEKFARQ